MTMAQGFLLVHFLFHTHYCKANVPSVSSLTRVSDATDHSCLQPPWHFFLLCVLSKCLWLATWFTVYSRVFYYLSNGH